VFEGRTICEVFGSQEEFIMRYYIAAAALALGMALGPAAFATPSWGYHGYHHESNGAATGQGSADNGYGYYHES
jgi:hypothetical protein